MHIVKIDPVKGMNKIHMLRNQQIRIVKISQEGA